MDYMHFSSIFIAAILMHLGYVCGQASLGQSLFATRTSIENGLNNENLQGRLSAYYQSVQSFPYHNTVNNVQNHPGYNYITPASTYTGYSTATHKTQTAPLAVSVHSDDYTKFDTTDPTFFLPKTKSPTSKALSEGQLSFYIPREQSKQTPSQVHDIANQNGNPIEINKQIQSDSRVKQSLSEAPQNWKPLPAQSNTFKSLPKSSKKPSFNIEIAQASGDTSDSFNQYIHEETNNYSGRTVGAHPSTLNQDLAVDCQRHPTSLQDQEVPLRSLHSLEGNNLKSVSGYQREKVPVLAPQNFPTAGYENALNQRRLNIIKSLLAEYIALTQSSNVPSENHSAQLYVKNDETTESVGDNGYPADKQLTQFPAYSTTRLPSPAANKFTDGDQTERHKYYQTQPIVPVVRQPHAVYGAPFVDNFKPASN